MDLAEWYARNRVVGLLELIDELPATSRLREAIMNDPEQAELMAALPDPEGEWRPRLAEWDLHAQILSQLHNVLGAIFQQLVANGGHSPPNVPAFPAPSTAVDLARELSETNRLLALEQKLTPKGGQ